MERLEGFEPSHLVPEFCFIWKEIFLKSTIYSVKPICLADLFVRLKGAKNGKVEQNMGEIAPQTAPLFNRKSD